MFERHMIRIASAALLAAVLAGCRSDKRDNNHASTDAAPPLLQDAEAHIRRLAAEGWEELPKEATASGPWQARVFHLERPWESPALKDACEAPQFGLPYRLILVRTDSTGPCVVREWVGGGEDVFYMYSSPKFVALSPDGPLVLSFERYCGGNAWFTQEGKLFLLCDDEPREITPELPDGWHVRDLEDIDNDLHVELRILVGEYPSYMGHCHASSPECYRIFSWDAAQSKFVETSLKHEAFYLRSIAEHRRAMKESPDDPWTGYPVSLLLDYWCMGRTREGWKEFSAHMDRMMPRLSAADKRQVLEMKADLAKRLGIDKHSVMNGKIRGAVAQKTP